MSPASISTAPPARIRPSVPSAAPSSTCTVVVPEIVTPSLVTNAPSNNVVVLPVTVRELIVASARLTAPPAPIDRSLSPSSVPSVTAPPVVTVMSLDNVVRLVSVVVRLIAEMFPPSSAASPVIVTLPIESPVPSVCANTVPVAAESVRSQSVPLSTTFAFRSTSPCVAVKVTFAPSVSTSLITRSWSAVRSTLVNTPPVAFTIVVPSVLS